jgi:hypothetical protein
MNWFMKSFKSILLVYVFTLNQTAGANCPEDIQVIEKGQVANCSGVLLSPEASKKADEAIEDSKYYKELSGALFKRRDLTNKEINILDQRLKLYQEQSERLAVQLSNKESSETWKNFGYLALGVIITGVAYKNLSP